MKRLSDPGEAGGRLPGFYHHDIPRFPAFVYTQPDEAANLGKAGNALVQRREGRRDITRKTINPLSLMAISSLSHSHDTLTSCTTSYEQDEKYREDTSAPGPPG